MPEASYPDALRWLPDPPPVLYARGELLPQDRLAIAVVGSRRPSRYGRSMAERFGAELAEQGFTVVSGLARGVDGLAHRGALRAGGRTIAVLGCGVNRVYPPEHRGLCEDICAQGAVLSEFGFDTRPQRWNFPRRNRIISGLTLGVVVVEATERSGSLLTARHAAEQGREVFAVPGRIDVESSRGAHRLIQGGAKLVTGAGDILDELPEAVRETALKFAVTPALGRRGRARPVGAGIPRPGAAGRRGDPYRSGHRGQPIAGSPRRQYIGYPRAARAGAAVSGQIFRAQSVP